MTNLTKYISEFPWKETLIILLLIFLTTSMNYIHINKKVIHYIADHHWVRFSIIFVLAYLSFSLSIDDEYSTITKVLAALLVAIIFHNFISINAKRKGQKDVVVLSY